MIIDLPTASEFDVNGKAFLNLSWETVIDLLHEVVFFKNNYDHHSDEERTELEGQYWKSAQHKLSTAIALAQQGTEFLLKGKIAAVSPFLLLAKEPKDWPKECETKNISFADFKTVDAHELIRLHNTVCVQKLPESFKTEFERLRDLRNKIMHAVDNRTKLSVKDVAVAILQISENLIGPKSWHTTRKKHFEENHNFFGMGSVDQSILLAMETALVVENLGLTKSELIQFYGFDRGQRRYICPDCRTHKINFAAKLAQLTPNTPESKKSTAYLAKQLLKYRAGIAKVKCARVTSLH